MIRLDESDNVGKREHVEFNSSLHSKIGVPTLCTREIRQGKAARSNDSGQLADKGAGKEGGKMLTSLHDNDGLNSRSGKAYTRSVEWVGPVFPDWSTLEDDEEE